MSKILFVLPVFLFLSCQSEKNSSSGSTREKIQYGDKILPGDLPPLSSDYRPKALSQKVFESSGITYVPARFLTQNLQWVFDVEARTTEGKARILFELSETGQPVFLMEPNVLTATLNGRPVSIGSVTDPDGLGVTLRSVQEIVEKGQPVVLELVYSLPSESVTYAEGGVGFLTSMSDLNPVRFFEKWGPANFEDNAFTMTVQVEVKNSAQQHQVFSNGNTVRLGPFSWTVTFPSYFTSSSFFLHLTNRVFHVRQFSVNGKERSIPVTVYSADIGLAEMGANTLPGLFQELEGDYGPYPHASFVAYMHSGSGGMEYSGATITGFGALDHELFHSWFARGVMPAEGRSGWIDEAMASWRDYGYFSASSLLSRTPTMLANYSPFRRSTPENCYRDGRQLLAELDLLLVEYGGLKPLIKSFFERYRYRVVTTEEFWAFIEAKSGLDVDPYFQRYVLGSANVQGIFVPDFLMPVQRSYHPTKLTDKEIRDLR